MLRDWLPLSGLVLEIASGAGEHAAWFSAAFPALTWQPTDRDPEALAMIAARRAAAVAANLLAPLTLDAAMPRAWPLRRADAIVAINMIHIAPWAATQGIMQGAARILEPGGVLVLYGPFREPGVTLAPSNAAFDADLRARNPEWGLRDLQAVAALTQSHRLELAARVPMPANNLGLVWRRSRP